MNLYTKEGRPLHVSGDKVYSKSGTPVGRIRGNKVFGTNGRYVGTIVGERLVYRRTSSGTIATSVVIAHRVGSTMGRRAASAISGEEPDIPD